MKYTLLAIAMSLDLKLLMKSILFALVLLGAFTCRFLRYRKKWAKRRSHDDR